MIKEFGKSKIRLGDVHDTAEIEGKLLKGVKADIFYSDPPWGDGNIKYWDTMNQKMNNHKESTGNFSTAKFLDTVLNYAVKHTQGWVVIEYGNKWVDDVIKVAESKGLIYCDKVQTLYGSTRKKPYPMTVMFFRTDKKVKVNTAPIKDTWNNETVQKVFETLFAGQDMTGKVAIDTCCGLGLTAKAALSLGMTFYGNELNATRIQKTYARFKGKF